ncbi:MAG: hypothetical protein U9M98_02530 [Patescibacteria group bacterium]|nr:hypothetical protein [Patescibacteria group bacterium]
MFGLPVQKKYLFSFFLLLASITIFVSHPYSLWAEDTDSASSDEQSEEQTEEEEEGISEEEMKDLEKEIEELEDKLSEARGRKTTLQNEIAYMDNQIYLTNLRINETQSRLYAKAKELEELNTDIEKLEERILTLDELLEEQKSVLQQRARESYKSSRFSTFELLFGARTLSRLIDRVKYLRVLEKKDQELIDEMEITKGDCTEQKNLLEVKKVEVEQVKAEIESYKQTLEAQKAQLDGQRREKENLLAATKNDEQKYQDLLREARAELAAMRAFVTAQGGATLLSGQTECDDWGCYYNQRDREWGTYNLGSSNYSVAGYGCLVSSVAMIATYHGYDITPKDIALVDSAFVPDLGYLYVYLTDSDGNKIPIEVNGFKFYRDLSWGNSSLDSALEKGPVIVRLSAFGGTHFVVIKEKKNGEYIMKDPWYEGANNVPLSKYYSKSSITRVDRVVVR